MAGRRFRAAVAAMLGAGLTCLALTVGLASAHTVSLFIYTGKSISGKGTTYINNHGNVATGIYESGEELPWHFSGFIAGADIHQQDGNLIVFDDGYAYAGNSFEYFQGMLSQFTGSGVPVPFSALTQNVNAIVDIPGYTGAIAVDNSGTSTNGNIYIHTWDNLVRGYDPNGTPLAGNFPINFGGESVSGLAVAPDGKIWVAIRNSSKVVQFTNGGAPTGVEVNLGFSPGWIETDGNGNLYVTAEGFGDTVKFNSAGTELFKVETEQYSSSVGVDPANGNVYIAHGNTISAYKSDGSFISTFGGPDPDHGFNGSGNIVDIAVNGSDHSIYIVDSAGLIHIFQGTGEITVPDVTTGGAEVTPTTATVHGTINPDGLDTTDCHFEYGPSTGYNEGAVTCVEGKVLSGTEDSPGLGGSGRPDARARPTTTGWSRTTPTASPRPAPTRPSSRWGRRSSRTRRSAK